MELIKKKGLNMLSKKLKEVTHILFLDRNIRLRTDFLFVCILFLLACYVANNFLVTFRGNGEFYQKQFAPAVLQACGHGFVNPATLPPALSKFLSLQQSTFDCSQLPQKITPTALNGLQISVHYLMSSMAIIWGLSQISWANALWLNIILFGLTIAGSYCVFRLGMSRFIASLGTTMLIFSAFHLSYLPQLRDYSVAPFVIWFMFSLGLLVTRSWPFKNLLILVLSTGILLGIEFGFRGDLLICVPFYLCAIFFFIPKAPTINWKEKLTLSFIFCGAFFVTSAPVLIPLHHQGSNMAHVIILGLMSPFTEALNLQSPVGYFLGHIYSDGYVQTIIDEYGQQILHHSPVGVSSPGYEQVGMSYLLEYYKNYPADVLIRFYSSIKKIIWPQQIIMPGALWLNWANKVVICDWFLTFAPWITFIILAFYRLRLALFYCLFLVFFAGYPVLQFHPRHYFYLELLNLWCVGFVLQWIVFLCTSSKQKTKNIWQSICLNWASVFALISGVLLLGWIALWGAREYQTQHLQELFTHYQHVEKKPLSTKELDLGDQKKILITIPFKPNDIGIYLDLKLSAKCSKKGLNIAFKFNKILNGNPSMHFYLQNYGHEAQLYVPIYPQLNFLGIEIDRNDRACIANITELKPDTKITLRPVVWMPTNWRQQKLYQQEKLQSFFYIQQGKDEKTFTKVSINTTSMHVAHEDFIALSPLFSQQKEKIKIYGRVSSANMMSYIASGASKIIKLKNGEKAIFFAEGTVYRGGVSIGLLDKEGHWDTVASTMQAGPFQVYFEISKSGIYRAIIANDVLYPGISNITIRKIGWKR